MEKVFYSRIANLINDAYLGYERQPVNPVTDMNKDMDVVDINPDSHLHFYLRAMQVWGMWPYKSQSSFITAAHWIYSKLMMISLLVISIQQLLQMTISPDLENISAAIDVASLTLAALYRQALFMFYIKDFKSLVDKVDSNFLPHKMPYNVKFDINRWIKYARSLTYVYFFLPVLIIIAWVTSRNIDNIKISQELEKISFLPAEYENLTTAEQMALNLTSEVRDEEVLIQLPKTNLQHVKRRLPVNCWYPFDSGVSPAFEIAFVWETSMAAVCGMAYVISDALLFMIIYLICGQLQIIKISLYALKEDYTKLKETVVDKLIITREKDTLKSPTLWEGYSKEREIAARMEEAMIKCVDYHNEILRVIEDMDLMLRTSIVVDFLHAVVSLSFAMLQTVIANTIYEWLQMILFIGTCILHQFLNNLFCEVLIQQQETLAEAAYDAPWVEGSSTQKTVVYMIMVQARKPLRLSGWKMYVLGLSTFVDFIKLLSSYFLVLQTLHAEEKKE